MLNYSPSESVQNFLMRFNTIVDKILLHVNISFMRFIFNKRGFKRVDDSFRICIFFSMLN